MVCENCKLDVMSIVIHDKALWCWSCHNGTKLGIGGAAPAVHGDECDVWINHGICNDDGSPKRYRSKAEIKQAAYEKGLFQGYDTPKVNHRLMEERAKAKGRS